MSIRQNDVTILIVEDDEVNVMYIQESLKRRRIGNRTVVASDGVEALDILRGSSGKEPLVEPYLILLDISMPRMDGFQFLKHLRGDERLKRSVVFILTSSDEERDRFQAYSHNVSGYILKNDVGSELIDKLQIIEDFLLFVRFPPKLS